MHPAWMAICSFRPSKNSCPVIFVKVRVTGADEYDLIGEIDDEFTE